MVIAFGFLGTEIFRWEFHREPPISTDPRLLYDFEEVIAEPDED